MAIDFGPIPLSFDPFANLRLWLGEAEISMGENREAATAMVLATASATGIPSARVVLFKGTTHDSSGREGVRIFTNYDSPKSQDLIANPHAALVFYWPKLQRQVRINGSVQKLSEAESNAYHASRPRGSRIGAWASPQSQKMTSRQELIERVHAVEARFSGAAFEPIPRPENWGGWLLVPSQFEFWQAGESRLHDRFLFEFSTDHQTKVSWRVSRLAP